MMGMSYKDKVYRLPDGYSYLCLSEKEEMLVFAQAFYIEENFELLHVSLDNIQLISKAEIEQLEFLEDAKETRLQFGYKQR